MKYVMKVLVGSGCYVLELVMVEVGGKYVIGVDFNVMYCEYIVGIDVFRMEKFIVSIDDLCDNMCIIIKEEDCKFRV